MKILAAICSVGRTCKKKVVLDGGVPLGPVQGCRRCRREHTTRGNLSVPQKTDCWHSFAPPATHIRDSGSWRKSETYWSSVVDPGGRSLLWCWYLSIFYCNFLTTLTTHPPMIICPKHNKEVLTTFLVIYWSQEVN